MSPFLTNCRRNALGPYTTDILTIKNEHRYGMWMVHGGSGAEIFLGALSVFSQFLPGCKAVLTAHTHTCVPLLERPGQFFLLVPSSACTCSPDNHTGVDCCSCQLLLCVLLRFVWVRLCCHHRSKESWRDTNFSVFSSEVIIVCSFIWHQRGCRRVKEMQYFQIYICILIYQYWLK